MYVYSNKLKIRSHDANHDKVEIFFFGGGGGAVDEIYCLLKKIKWLCLSNLDMH